MHQKLLHLRLRLKIDTIVPVLCVAFVYLAYLIAQWSNFLFSQEGESVFTVGQIANEAVYLSILISSKKQSA
jgi:hypothetical protein